MLSLKFQVLVQSQDKTLQAPADVVWQSRLITCKLVFFALQEMVVLNLNYLAKLQQWSICLPCSLNKWTLDKIDQNLDMHKLGHTQKAQYIFIAIHIQVRGYTQTSYYLKHLSIVDQTQNLSYHTSFSSNVLPVQHEGQLPSL